MNVCHLPRSERRTSFPLWMWDDEFCGSTPAT